MTETMMIKQYIAASAVLALSLGLGSCSDFLSTLPDNRVEVDTPEDIRKLLITAYPDRGYTLIAEYSSDNVQENMDAQSFSTRFLDQIYNWDDITESDNESSARAWEAYYRSLLTANSALEIIEKQGNPASLDPHRGEALMIRAFSHFMLVNLFSEAYDPATAEQKLGVVYVTKPEKSITSQHTRASLAECIAGIQSDIETALGLIRDSYYPQAQKYHFTRRAAYALATRFYLYTRQWAKAEAAATVVLGDTPSASILRDYAAILALPGGADGFEKRGLQWISHQNANNLLLMPVYSSAGRIYGFYVYGSRYFHQALTSSTETFGVNTPWGISENVFKLAPVTLADPHRKVLMPRLPDQMEYTDRLAGNGYVRTTVTELTTDETLLSRAESRVLQSNFDGALADLNTYLSNAMTTPTTLTDAMITTWNTSVAYYTPTAPTPRKQLNPSNLTLTEKQEQYLQVVLHLRRLETVHSGLRWFDIKRYGIEITRVQVVGGTRLVATDNVLKVNDKRRAFEIPLEALSLGIKASRK